MLVVFVLFLSFTSSIKCQETNNGRTEGQVDPSLMNLQASYLVSDKSLFAAKRREQIETAEKILGLNDYARQYKMVEMLGDTVFPAMTTSRTKLNEVGYIAGTSSFPQEKEMQEIISVIYESIPFFGDILLRLPDITKDVYKRHKTDWIPIFEWGMEFCKNSSSIFNGHHATQLHLMSQEIGLIPEDPNYMNPFRKPTNKDGGSGQGKASEKKKEKRKKTKKGPKLRTSSRNEL